MGGKKRSKDADAPSNPKRARKDIASKSSTANTSISLLENQNQPAKVLPGTEPAKSTRAPIDDTCPIKESSEVCVDAQGLNYDASLNLSDIAGNNNKFYYLQLLNRTENPDEYAVWTHWGRVGEKGQNKLEQNLSSDAAKASFNKKFKGKTGLSWEKRSDPPKANKYTLIEKSYGEDSEDEAESSDGRPKASTMDEALPDCTLDKELQPLIQFLFDSGNMQKSMASQNYNYKKLPLGKLSKRTIEKGYLALKQLGDVIINPHLAESKYQMDLEAAFNDLSSQYYSIVPHDFGRKKPVPISTEGQLKVEMDLIETLGNMQISNEIIKETKYPKDSEGRIIHPLDAQMRLLRLDEAISINRTSDEFYHLQEYLGHSNEGGGVLSDTSIEHIYRVSRSQEADRFASGGFDVEGMKPRKLKDHRRLLWHGSRGCNFGGILSQGLRIAPPEAPANGKAFGKGLYFADRSSKSAAYCDPWTSGQRSLLLLCEVQLGSPSYVKRDHEYNAAVSMRQQGHISTKMAVGSQNEPPKWMDAGVANPQLEKILMPDHSAKFPPATGFPNEYIVYDVAQIKIRYVFMLKWSTSRQWGIY